MFLSLQPQKNIFLPHHVYESERKPKDELCQRTGDYKLLELTATGICGGWQYEKVQKGRRQAHGHRVHKQVYGRAAAPNIHNPIVMDAKGIQGKWTAEGSQSGLRGLLKQSLLLLMLETDFWTSLISLQQFFWTFNSWQVYIIPSLCHATSNVLDMVFENNINAPLVSLQDNKC